MLAAAGASTHNVKRLLAHEAAPVKRGTYERVLKDGRLGHLDHNVPGDSDLLTVSNNGSGKLETNLDCERQLMSEEAAEEARHSFGATGSRTLKSKRSSVGHTAATAPAVPRSRDNVLLSIVDRKHRLTTRGAPVARGRSNRTPEICVWAGSAVK